MARPRKFNVDVQNLYCKTDTRTNKVYWQYKHPVTGRFIGLGTDREAAIDAAIEANRRIAESQTSHLNVLLSSMAGNGSTTSPLASGMLIRTWADKYLAIQQDRMKSGEIKQCTVEARAYGVSVLLRTAADVPLSSADTKIFSTIIDEYRSRGKNRMGQSLRATWIDLFKEAQHAGEVAPGFNPAAATKSPRVKVSRLRLDLSEWKRIFQQAEGKPYLQNGMLLALLTAQRPMDLCGMKFSDIWDDHLHITQSKTGAKLALPLSLRLDPLGITLGEVVDRCRGTGRSKFLLHYTTRGRKYGTQVKPTVISVMFANARDAAKINWGDGTPPSFYEQRSLSERLYHQQGIDTQVLLGHKHQRMTDLYHDDRGKEWTKLVI